MCSDVSQKSDDNPSIGHRFRAVAPQTGLGDRLGALSDLPGYWQGTGFSLIARPDSSAKDGDGFFLELNLLQEALDITTIGSPVFNRGSLQGDIAMYGVTYLHRVTDLITGGAIHIEPGLWLNIPATSAPSAAASIARLATIPHGNAVCTVGFVEHAEFDRIPDIPPANTVPFPIGSQPPPPGTANSFKEYDLSQPSKFRSASLPEGITQAMVTDPNQMLRDTLARQVNQEGKTINWITRLITRTPNDMSIGNIPFITSNANTLQFTSVVAIESLTDAEGTEYLQLQYSQTALIDFRGLRRPHVTVGTLVKSF